MAPAASARLKQSQIAFKVQTEGLRCSAEWLSIELNALQAEELAHFRAQLAELAALGTTSAELAQLSSLIQALADLRPPFFITAYSATAGLLVLPNSRKLHRQLLKALQASPDVQEAAQAALAARFTQAAAATPLALADALASLLAIQPPHTVGCAALAACAPTVALSLAASAEAAQRASAAGTAPSPQVADSVHSALGVIYHLVARPGVEAALPAVESACLSFLQHSALSRDAALTAAVALAAAAVAGRLPEAAACMLGAALFPSKMRHDGVAGSLDHALSARGSSFTRECAALTPFGRLAMLKAALAAAPPSALAAPVDGWSLLYDGILPELCMTATVVDCAHMRYHAIAGAATGAQRIALLGPNAPALPGTLYERLQVLARGGWDDPQPQVVRAVTSLFDALLDIPVEGRAASSQASHACALAVSLLHHGPRKGRYAPLCSLVRRCRATLLLAECPTVVPDTLATIGENTIAAAAAAFMKVLTEDFRTEMTALHTSAEAERRLHLLLVSHLQEALLGEGQQRSNLGAYVLPALLKTQPSLAAALLDTLGGDFQEAQASGLRAREQALLAAIVTVLRCGRGAGLSGPDGAHTILYSTALSESGIACVPASVLLAAATARDPGTRSDALDLLCNNPRGAELPGADEAAALRAGLALALAGGGAASGRNRASGLLRRLLPRLAAGLERAGAPPSTTAHTRPAGTKGRSLVLSAAAHARDAQRVPIARALVSWLLTAAMCGSYPGAPFERKFMAIDTLEALALSWNPSHAAGRLKAGDADGAWPYTPALLSAPWVAALLGAQVDTWDVIRSKCAALLDRHAAPLPGFTRSADIAPLVAWAKSLCRSPRVREGDAAALLLRTLAAKYAVNLQWTLLPEVSLPEAPTTASFAAAAHLTALVDDVEADVIAAEADVHAASRRALIHGSLLTLRLALPILPIYGSSTEADAAVREALERLMQLMQRATDLAITAVAAPELVGATAAEVADGSTTGGVGVGSYFGGADDDGSEDGSDCDDASPSAQMVMTSAWLTMKEVALCTGALASVAPARLLPLSALVDAGDALVRVLLASKHNGAVDKAREGLTQVAARLLQVTSGPSALAPAAWVEQLLATLQDPTQGVRSLVRRSAGLPAALLALCAAEPIGVQRTLLPLILSRCLATARAGALLTKADTAFVPAVHSLNVLRCAFGDGTLVTETAGSLAEGVLLALACFQSPHWAVRNGAGLALATLAARTTGALNPSPLVAGPRLAATLTAPRFFSRFPALLPAFTQLLACAAEQCTRNELHLALMPCLALLSRLRPADSGGPDEASEEALADLAAAVAANGSARHAYARLLAARALVPLIRPACALAHAASLLDRLPASPQDARAQAGGYNAVHGALLQVAALARSAVFHQSALPSASLCAQLRRLCWLASAPPALVRMQYADVLLALVPARKSQPESAELWCLIGEVVAVAQAAPESAEPGAALWRKRAGSLHAAAALRSGGVAGLLSEATSSYEAQGAVLKALQAAAALGELFAARPEHAALAPDLAALLGAGSHQKNASRCLALLRQTSTGLPAALPWWEVEALATRAHYGRLRCEALLLLATFIPSDADPAMCSALVDHLSRESAASAPPEHRAAAAAALRVSGLLGRSDLPGGEAGPSPSLRAWFVALRLLVDEDSEIRDAAATAVWDALGSAEQELPALSAAVAHLTATHAAEPAWHAWLLSICAGQSPAAELRRGAALTKRLFDEEAPNLHEETLVTAQLAARGLRQLAHRPGAAATLGAAAEEAAMLLGKIYAAAPWPAGVTTHPSVFMPCYQMLLGAWALAPSLADGVESASLNAGVHLLAGQLEAMQPHPLLRGMADAALAALQNAEPVSFDPLFLCS